MSLITEGPQGPQEPTTEQKKNRAKRNIQRKVYETYQGLISSYNDIRTAVWENPAGLTPQEVFDALGTDGAELFQLSALLVNTVNSAKPDTLSGDQPYEFTVNPDGSVTVGNKIEE